LILLITIFSLSYSTIPILIGFVLITLFLYIPRTEIEIDGERRIVFKRIVLQHLKRKAHEISISFSEVKSLIFTDEPYNIYLELVNSLKRISIYKENSQFSMRNIASWQLCKAGCNRIIQHYINGSEMVLNERVQFRGEIFHPFTIPHFWENRKTKIFYFIDYNLQDIAEISDLLNISNLEILFFSQNSLKGIEEFYSLNKMKILILDKNRINSLKGIEKNKTLELISMSKNHIEIVEGLQDLLNLIFVDLSFNRIHTIPLFHGTKIRVLALNNNIIMKMENLHVLENLEELYLDQNQILKIEELDRLEKLKILSLNGNKITTLFGLANLSNLKVLSLSNNEIFKITSMDNMKDLRILDLYNNQILCIEGLHSTKNLEELYLGSNRISKIENVAHLEKLRELHLPENDITQISNLSSLSGLEVLDLASNKITSMDGIQQLISIKELDLSDNLISSIMGLENLSNLERFNIRGNKIPQNILDSLGGLDFLGYANEPRKFVEYCRKKQKVKEEFQMRRTEGPIHNQKEIDSFYLRIQNIKEDTIILHKRVE